MKARIEYNQYPDSAAATFFSKLGGACGYLLIPLGAWWIFKEPITRRKMVAIGIIIVGVIVFFL